MNLARKIVTAWKWIKDDDHNCKRQVYYRLIRLCLVVVTPFMLWAGLKVFTNCSLPVLVVLSGGYGPPSFLGRGDLLFLTNYEEPIRAGEIIIYTLPSREIPIAHRVIKLHEKRDGTVQFLTKGDYNAVDDRGLYPHGQFWLEKKHVIGKAKGYLPYIGIVAVIFLDNPNIKYVFLAWISIRVLRRR